MRATSLVRAVMAAALATTAVGCGDDSSGGGAADMAMAGSDMTLLAHGCAPLTAPVTTPDGGAGGDTWANYAQGFFAMYCTRCHATTLTGSARNGAPSGYDWDDEPTVQMHLEMIRSAVGVINIMPFTPPDPTCAERRRIVRWIDAAAP
ncbi:MAG: uncharacterized protein JWM53_1282 [bacterium]|nr:uncharacterized protein [bacterium]